MAMVSTISELVYIKRFIYSNEIGTYNICIDYIEVILVFIMGLNYPIYETMVEYWFQF